MSTSTGGDLGYAYIAGENGTTNSDEQWTEFIGASMSRITSYVRSFARNDHDVADIIGETVARAWIKRDQGLGDHPPMWTLVRLVREVSREWVAANRREVPFDTAAEPVSNMWAEADCTSMSIDEAEAQRRWSERVLSQLSDNQRMVVDLRCRWGWQDEIIAATLGTAQATIRVHAHRGLRRLQKIVAADPMPMADSGGL